MGSVIQRSLRSLYECQERVDKDVDRQPEQINLRKRKKNRGHGGKPRVSFSNASVDKKNTDVSIPGSVTNTSQRTVITRIIEIRNIVESLELSMKLSRSLEVEQLARYSTLKMKNGFVLSDLRQANKRNKDMLNLFRQSVTGISHGSQDTLPEYLKKAVQKTWHQKYDTLLTQNERMKEDILNAKLNIKEKTKQIAALEKKSSNLAESLLESDKSIKSICAKYLRLKKRKDEEEILLRGSIETLQEALQNANNTATLRKLEMSLVPSKDALLTRETRRSDRLAHENALLRTLLHEARRECKSSRASSTVTFERTA